MIGLLVFLVIIPLIKNNFVIKSHLKLFYLFYCLESISKALTQQEICIHSSHVDRKQPGHKGGSDELV